MPGWPSWSWTRCPALRRVEGDRCEFLLVTLWDDMDAVKAFAGEEPGTAVFYPQDDRFLVDRDLMSHHYEVVAAPGGA